MRRDLSIAIIGGSLVGPTLKLLLEQRGFTDVTVYEAMNRAQSRSGGIMGLRYPTISALESVGIDRRTITALRDKNTYAYDITKGGVPVSRGVSDFPGVVTSWDALHEQLAERVEILYNHRLTGLTPDGDGAKLTFANGKTAEADLVLFADGRKSTGRELLDPGRRLQYQGYTVWRGLSEPPRPVPTGFNRYFDTEGGRLFSVTGPILQSGKSYWELSHNLAAVTWRAIAGGSPEDRAYLLPTSVTRLAREVVHQAMTNLPKAFRELVDGAEISGIPVSDTRMPDRAAFEIGNAWAALIGDALIPVRLQVGAGLNQGLLEAVDLVDRLAVDDDMYDLMRKWEDASLDALARWVELGRSRVSRLNLGRYEPVRPGYTAVPTSDSPFDEPAWVLA